eukprot:XP_001703743.1 predicted protein [Chlamydomonas reinhardtii]
MRHGIRAVSPRDCSAASVSGDGLAAAVGFLAAVRLWHPQGKREAPPGQGMPGRWHHRSCAARRRGWRPGRADTDTRASPALKYADAGPMVVHRSLSV